MLRWGTDENFSEHIVVGLIAREPAIDLVRIDEVFLRGAEDPAILAWSAQEDRVLLTHDRGTMRAFAEARIGAGEAMPGIVFVKQNCADGRAIDEILLMEYCSEADEWRNRIIYIPM